MNKISIIVLFFMAASLQAAPRPYYILLSPDISPEGGITIAFGEGVKFSEVAVRNAGSEKSGNVGPRTAVSQIIVPAGSIRLKLGFAIGKLQADPVWLNLGDLDAGDCVMITAAIVRGYVKFNHTVTDQACVNSIK